MNNNHLNKEGKTITKTDTRSYSTRKYVYLLIGFILLITIATSCFLWWQLNKLNKIEAIANEYHLSTMQNCDSIAKEMRHIESHIYQKTNQRKKKKKQISTHFFNFNSAFIIIKEKTDFIKHLQQRYNHKEYANILKNYDNLLIQILIVKENIDFTVVTDANKILKMIAQLNTFVDQLLREHTIAYDDLISELSIKRPKIFQNISIFLFSIGIIGFLIIIRILHLIKITEKELDRHRRHLQKQVMERTLDITKVNEDLKQEIEERKYAEKNLKQSEDRYRSVVEDTPVLICCFKLESEITFVNKAYCDFFGKSSDELVGSSFLTLIPETDRKFVTDNIAMLNSETPEQSHEHRAITPEGDTNWQHWTNRGLFDTQGQILGYQSIGLDITERKKGEKALKNNQNFLDRIINQSPFATWVSDKKGTIIKCNVALEKLLNITGEQLIGKYNVFEDEIAIEQGLIPKIRTVFEDGKTANFSVEWDANEL
ncbi:MAG: PAS domain S-box protein, partial [Desulfobacula sp.]|nr:PAS domain S-box protein [Desulfobacula sp.]